MDEDAQFSVIGKMNAVTCKVAFPLIRDNRRWLGQTIPSDDSKFGEPDSCPLTNAGWSVVDERTNVWTLAEMEVDHIKPWSKGGKTVEDGCRMLCRRYNNVKRD